MGWPRRLCSRLGRPRLLLLTGAALALQLACGLWWFGQGNFDLAMTQLKLATLPASMLVCVCLTFADGRAREVLASSRLAGLGDVSFGVYLSHIPFVIMGNKLLGLVGFAGTMGGALAVWAFVLGGSVLLALICSRLLPERLLRVLGFS